MVEPSESREGIGEGVEKEKRTRVESLGWLTESAVMPKKQKVISGVGASSIVGLKAELYRSQEEAKRNRDSVAHGEAPIPRKRIEKNDPFSKKNPNVEQRAERDEVALQASKDVYGSLVRKAELYNKLAKGEVPDEEEKEKYSVDFVRKGWLEEEREEMNRERDGSAKIWSTFDENMLAAGASDPSSSQFKSNNNRISDESEDPLSKMVNKNQSHKDLIREVNLETVEAREKAILLKEQRKRQMVTNRERLKMAILQKAAQKLKMQPKASNPTLDTTNG